MSTVAGIPYKESIEQIQLLTYNAGTYDRAVLNYPAVDGSNSDNSEWRTMKTKLNLSFALVLAVILLLVSSASVLAGSAAVEPGTAVS